MGPKIAGSSDDRMVEMLRRGDEEAFTSLFGQHQARLYRFAYHMSGSHSIAEETVQETFLTLIRQPDRFDPARGNVSAFLFGIARNHVLRALERDRRFTPLDAERPLASNSANGGSSGHDRALDGDDGTGTLAQMERRERIEGVRRAVLSLPPVYREVVVLCDLDQRSYADAAAHLECPVGTVRSRLNRARGLLLAKLGTSQNPAHNTGHDAGDIASADATDISETDEGGRWRRLGAGGRI
ncbi:MAG: RNA polymerase sigma factor [Candidatus Acidiferrales bacterium]